MIKPLKTKNYSIFFEDFEKEFSSFLSRYSYTKIGIIVDENTEKYCLPILIKIINKPFEIIKISSGEIHKNILTCQSIWTKMIAYKFGRDALIINLGGGVIGDMGGFCASTYKRGIDFIQIPTTLLSQVDASVGGKLGIDFNEVKNSIGVFNDPKAVFIHPLFLETLPQREIRSGFAEIIKHALIKDKNQWSALLKINHFESIQWSSIILESVRIKYNIVIEDPFENGIRKALNFGHTIGHAIESVFLRSKEFLLHGEAIAIGMICESYLSLIQLNLSREELNEISSFIITIYGHHHLNENDFEDMFKIMMQDKKNIGNEINFSLLNSIGNVKVNQVADLPLIKESLLYYNSLK